MKYTKALLALFIAAALLSSCKKDKGTQETLTWTYDNAWGGGGTGDGQFNLTTGLAVDASGNQYISDINQQRVQKMGPTGTFVTKWGSYGTGDGDFDWPRDIVVDDDGGVEVIDQHNNRIQKFTANGVYVSQFGSAGTADGQFGEMYNMDRDANGILYVVDYGNVRIQKFSTTRAHLLSWSYGLAFGDPTAIACSKDGDVFVSFWNNYAHKGSIVHYNPTGTLQDSWQVTYADSLLGYIMDMDFDSEDNLHVGGGDATIKIFKKDGTFIKEWGKLGNGPGEILSLNKMCFGPNDDLYIAGCLGNNNCRISKFKRSN